MILQNSITLLRVRFQILMKAKNGQQLESTIILLENQEL